MRAHPGAPWAPAADGAGAAAGDASAGAVARTPRAAPSTTNPSAALLKATLIHSAQYTPFRYHTPAAAQWAEPPVEREHAAVVVSEVP